MSEPIQVKYEDVEITYNESENRWKFELRGRNRSSESLEKAKEAIDKPVDEKVEKTFKRTAVFYSRYGSEYLDGEATSVAESPGYGAGHIWVVGSKDKSRQKIAAREVFPKTDANIKTIADIVALDKQIESLSEQRREIARKLVTIEV